MPAARNEHTRRERRARAALDRLGTVVGTAMVFVYLWAVLLVFVLLHLLPWWPHNRREWVLFIVLGPPAYVLLELIGQGLAEGFSFRAWPLWRWRPTLGWRIGLWSVGLGLYAGLGVALAALAVAARSRGMLLIFVPVWLLVGWLPGHYWWAAWQRWREGDSAGRRPDEFPPGI